MVAETFACPVSKKCTIPFVDDGKRVIVHYSLTRVVTGVAPLPRIDFVLILLQEGMPAVRQNVCMSSFLCFCFVCFVDHVCSSLHRGSQTKKHCRRSLWSPASDLCKLMAIFLRAVNGSMSGWHWDCRFCMSTKHWRTVGLLRTPLGTCHMRHSWLKIPLACMLRGVLPCVVKQMSLHWTVTLFTSQLLLSKVWRRGSLLFHRQPQLPTPC